MTDVDRAPSEVGLDPLEHFICCDDPHPEGAVTVAFCGTPTLREMDAVIAVSCVVCTDLEAHDWCPSAADHRCPYAKVD